MRCLRLQFPDRSWLDDSAWAAKDRKGTAEHPVTAKAYMATE
jgi:hypothetical protein